MTRRCWLPDTATADVHARGGWPDRFMTANELGRTDEVKTDGRSYDALVTVLDRLLPELDQARERLDVPGIALAVYDGKHLTTRSLGVRDLEQGLPMTTDTVLAVGSVTKSFTASLLATLVAEERLAWDDPVRSLCSDIAMSDVVASAELTVRDMLSHRSGLPRHDMAWYGEENCSRSEMVRRIRHLPVSARIRAAWQYNNLMYIAAAHLAEQLTGSTWEDAVSTRLLKPLEMSRTGFSVTEMAQLEDAAVPYVDRKNGIHPVPLRTVGVSGPCGGINASINDLGAWLRLQIDPAAAAVPGLTGDVLRSLHTPAMALPETGQLYEEATHTAYGMGWFIDHYRGHTLVQHGGNIDGFTAYVAFLPRLGVGVAALANLGATSLPTVAAYRILDDLLNLEPVPWLERMSEMRTLGKSASQELKAHRRKRQQQTPPSLPLSSYAGEYAHPGYGRFEIRLEGETLVPLFHSLGGSLRHRHFDVFEYHLPHSDDEESTGTPLSFHLDFDGDVDGFTAPLEALVEPVRFKRIAQMPPADRLAGLAGTYAMGPIALTVALAEDHLSISTQGGQPGRLDPLRDLIFRSVKPPQGKVEFMLDEDGRVAQLLVDSVGVFLPVIGDEAAPRLSPDIGRVGSAETTK